MSYKKTQKQQTQTKTKLTTTPPQENQQTPKKTHATNKSKKLLKSRKDHN